MGVLHTMKPLLVTTTCETLEDAKAIARAVLAQKCAACVQISAPATSMYWWNDVIAEEPEFILTMKSEAKCFDTLCLTIKEHHRYEVPEIIATDIAAGDKAYLQWLAETLAVNSGE